MSTKMRSVIRNFASSLLLTGLSSIAIAATYEASSSKGGPGTSGCTYSNNCSDAGWGIDLNGGTGFKWTINSSSAGAKSVYFKLAATTSTRTMSLWVNGTKTGTITINSTQAPNPTGAEFGPYNLNFIAGNNTVEFRDTEGTMEFDVHYLRTVDSNGRNISNNLEAESNDGASGISIENTNDSSGNQNAYAIDANDYIQWQVSVPTAGNYKLSTRSSAISNPRIEILVDNNYTAEMGLSNTGSLNTWQDFESSVFALPAGTHTLRVRFATGNQKLNWIKLNSTNDINPAEAFTTGLWRLVSRNDRGTLTVNNSGVMSINDYSAQTRQQWRLSEFGNGDYEFQNEFSGQCLIPQGGSAALGTCGNSANNWKIETLRARSEDRPAIYRLRSAQNTCLIPNGSGAPQVGACNTLSRWYLEAVGFGERSAAAEYELRSLLIVKPETNVTNFAQGTIPQDIVSAAQVSHNQSVNSWFNKMTDGRVQFTGQSVVALEPIRTLTEGGGNWLPAAVNLPNDVQRFVPRGTYDTVQIFFTGGNQPGGWGWGPGRSIASNDTLWTTVNGGDTPAYRWLSTSSEPTEVFIHEPMHGLDSHFDALGLPLPEGYLHGTESNRYSAYLGIEGWVHWYRDYWLGTVIASDDTYRGYGPRMFRMQKVRDFASSQPESGVKIMHATSGKCLSTQTGTIAPATGSNVVFSSNCNTAASTFTLQSNGMLKHNASGMCIHPSGGTANDGTPLLFWPSCTLESRLTLGLIDSGSIQHTETGRCIHPNGGSSTPADGTLAVFYSGCDEERLRYTFQR